MANRGVTGKIQDSLGLGLKGLVVEVMDHDALFSDDRLGEALTDGNGDFSVAYPAGKYGLEANPDLKVRIRSPYGRLICETEVFEDFTPDVLDVETLTIPANDIGGWLSNCRSPSELILDPLTHTIPSKTSPLVTPGNRLTPLIDNVEAWHKVSDSVREAKQSINLAQFYFDVGAVFTEFPTDDKMLGPKDPIPYARLEDQLRTARANGRDVRILIRDAHFTAEDLALALADLPVWEFALALVILGALGPLVALFVGGGGGLPYPIDTADQVTEFFGQPIDTADEVTEFFGQGPRPKTTREFRSAVSRPLHAKFLVIDHQKGIFCTSPLTQDYFDSTRHVIDEPRRGLNKHQALGLLPRSMGTAKLPVHDVSLLLEGPVVQDMDRFFYQLWNNSGPAETMPTGDKYPLPIQQKDVTTVQLVRTISPNRLSDIPGGEQGVLEAYLRAIENARNYVYIEDQYYTEPLINDALLTGLATIPHLRVILLLNFSPDVPGYLKAQQNLVRQLLESAHKDRVRVFTIWTFNPASKRVLANYIHSKVAIVDDVWATAGSANLDQAGMHRSIELNAVMGIAIGGGTDNQFPAELRVGLWREHLGLNEQSDLAALDVSQATLLQSWDARADALVQGLKGVRPFPDPPPRILRYSFEDKPKKYLIDLGIDVAPLQVLDEAPRFSFDKGKWV